MKDGLVTKWWLWPSALSLEAPAVALAWQDLLARTHGGTVLPAGRCALGLAVWSVYVADRLIDVRFHDGLASHSLPHRFCHRYRQPLVGLLAITTAAGAFLAAFWVRPPVAVGGAMLVLAVATYLLLFSWQRAFEHLKPLAAALLFTAGVFLAAWTRTTSPLASLAPDAAVFFALCLGNLMLARSATAAGIGMAALAVVSSFMSNPGWYPVAAAGLALLALFARRLPGSSRAILADSMLLIPAVRLWMQTG